MMTVASYSSSHHHLSRQIGSSDSPRGLGPLLNVVTWILLITSSLAVGTRLITKRALRRRIDVDDLFVIAALCASIGSGASVSIQATNGLGCNLPELKSNQVLAYQKAEYANKLLYIATLAFAKLSITSLLMILTASEFHRYLSMGLAGFVAVWGFISELVAVFQCGSVEPWRFLGRDCVDPISFWLSVSIFNILTDLALILFPLHVIVTLQMSLGKKVTIMVFFGARSFDIVATGVQIAYLYGFSSPNPTRDLWEWTLATQIIECTTILTSCVPHLRPLLESLPSGLYGSDKLRRRGTPSELGYSRSKSGSYQLSSSHSNVKQHSYEKNSQTRKSLNETGVKRFLPMLSQGGTTHSNSASGLPGGPRRPDGEIGVKIVALRRAEGEERRWEIESTDSNSKILKTTVVSAEWEEAQRKSRDVNSLDIEVLE